MSQSDSHPLRNVNWVFVAVITVILLLAIWQVRGIIMLVVAAIMLSVFVTMPVRFFLKNNLNRIVSIIISMFLGTILISILFAVLLPPLLRQFAVLGQEIVPAGFQAIIEWWNSGVIFEQIPFLEDVISSATIDQDLLNRVVEQFSNALGLLGGSVLPLLGGVANALLSSLIVIFLCTYFVAEPDRYLRGIIALTPLWYRERMRFILLRLDDTIRAWIRVTAVSMLFVGVFTSIGLALVGIQQWAALGVLAGLMSFIPNFGPIVALVPSIAVAIIQAPEYLLLVVLIIYGVSFVQSQLVGPVLASENMNLAPVLVLIGQIVFGVFFGFMGLMLAVPLTAMVVVLVSEIYVKDLLGDSHPHRKQTPSSSDDMVELMPSPD